MTHHHNHLILIRIAEIAITAGAAALAAHSAQKPANGLVTPVPVHRAHPIVAVLAKDGE